MHRYSAHLHERTQQALWLRVETSTRFDARAIDEWRVRLHTHLSRLGLTAAVSPGRLAIVAEGRDISPYDRGLAIGWLIGQAEVVFVHIERKGALSLEQGPQQLSLQLSVPLDAPTANSGHRRA